jgi:hypothetical protein
VERLSSPLKPVLADLTETIDIEQYEQCKLVRMPKKGGESLVLQKVKCA